MVWAELWSWDSSLCSLTFSGSFTFTFSFSWLSLSRRGSALLSACLALLARLISLSDFWSPAGPLLDNAGFSTRIERGSVAGSARKL